MVVFWTPFLGDRWRRSPGSHIFPTKALLQGFGLERSSKTLQSSRCLCLTHSRRSPTWPGESQITWMNHRRNMKEEFVYEAFKIIYKKKQGTVIWGVKIQYWGGCHLVFRRGKLLSPSSRWRMGTATCGGDVYGTSCDCHELEWIYCHLTSRIHGYVKSFVATRWRS